MNPFLLRSTRLCSLVIKRKSCLYTSICQPARGFSSQINNSSKRIFYIPKRFYASDSRDYYELLGVSKNASDKEIKKAFRKLAKELHPDMNKGDKDKEKRFQDVSAAYDCLSNPEKRKQYDMMGHSAYNEQGYAQGAPDIEDILNQFGFGGGGDFGSMFENAFGGGGRSRTQSRGKPGQSLEISQTISFMEAVSGVKKEVSYSTRVACEPCKGQGTKDGKKPSACPACGGSGTQTASQGGLFFIQQTCSSCHGTGEKITNPCTSCGGRGTSAKRVTLEVSFPSGINNQDTLRIPRKGCAGEKGGPSGDLFITVKVEPHKYFKRDGNDIHLEVPLSLTQAIFGDSVQVPSVSGKNFEVKVKPGTQSGERNILRGKGIQRKGRFDIGNQILTWKVKIPSVNAIDESQKELFEKIQQLEEKPEGFKET